MGTKELKPPKKSAGDAAHALTRAGLSRVPVVGGTAAELFQAVIQPPLEKRRDEWMREVGERLMELEDNGLKVEGLRDNEQFISAVIHITQLAIKTHLLVKRIALKNALANIAKGRGPDDIRLQIFLDMVDSFTELHIDLLRVFLAPEAPPGMSMGGLDAVLLHNLPKWRDHINLVNQVWSDLWRRGLLDAEGLNVTVSSRELSRRRTTPLGEQFLTFISDDEL